MDMAAERNAVGLTIDGVKKWYGEVPAVRGVSLSIEPGEIVSFLGPSGCGKTTTLRIIAGLETPDEGQIRIGGNVVNDMPPWQRNIGMMFQSYALFPHMSVAENVAFGLAMRGVPATQMRERVEAVMAQVRLSGFGGRYPSQLSGGQRQRVALARAIVTQPNVLLLDEPLAALDKKLREEMQVEIKQLQRSVGITTIFVTHDQEEALSLSDRIVVMEDGRIVQIGTASEVYERPRSRFVSDFIGFTNAVAGTVKAVTGGKATVALASGQVFEASGAEDLVAGAAVDLVIRPEKILLEPSDDSSRYVVEGTLAHIVYMGAVTYYHVDIGHGAILIAMAPNQAESSRSYDLGARMRLGWKPEAMLLFPRRV